MSNYFLQIHVLIEVRRCGSCLLLHIKHPSIPKPVWHKLTEPKYCPFSSTFRRCIFVRQVELAPGRFVLPSGHARTQPARAFPAQTVKTGWALLSTGSIVVLVLQALTQRFLPDGSEEGWAKAGKDRARTCTAARGGIHQGLHQFTSTSNFEHPFLLGGQWFPRHWEINHAEQFHVWACEELKVSSRPGEDLKLNEALPKACKQ